MGKKMNALVSIIIATKNEEKNIGNCLESIKAQTYLSRGSKATLREPQKNIEIIVVDNNSTDKTKEIAKKYTLNVFNFGPERSAQRNFGMLKKAKGKFVMYLDADMILSSTIIGKAVEKLENEEFLALYIPEIILGNSYWSRVRRFERSFYDGTVIDCVRIIRTDIFKKLGGFDETMTGPEDWDLDKRVRNEGKAALLCKYDFEEMNRKILDTRYSILDEKGLKKLMNLTLEPVIFHNEANFNLRKYLAKKKYYSKSFSDYVVKWGNQDADIKKQFGLFYRCFGVFCENGKWRNLTKFPLKTSGVFFLRFCVGAVFLGEKIRKI